MKLKNKICSIMSISMAFTVFNTTLNVKAAEAQWVKKDGQWSYIKENGESATGWLKDGNCWYAFDSEGVMRTGWVASNEHWYYMGESGVMQSGTWIESQGSMYYVKGTGQMAKDYIKDDYELNDYGQAIPLADSNSVIADDIEALKGSVIEGNLYIDVTNKKNIELSDVTVKGKLVIIGDNASSANINIKNSVIETISNQNRNTEIVLFKDADIKNVILEEAGNITADKSFKKTIRNIEIQSTVKDTIVINAPALNVVTRSYANIEVQSPVEMLIMNATTDVKVAADVKNIVITGSAAHSQVEIASGKTVETIIADAIISIDGKGTVNKLEANANGIKSSSSININEVEKNKEVTDVPEANKPSAGGSSGGGASGGSSNAGKVEIIFETNTSEVVLKSIYAEIGTTIKLPTNLTREGYVFDGWYRNPTLRNSEAYRNNELKVGHTARKIYAKWVKVFDSNKTLDEIMNDVNDGDIIKLTAGTYGLSEGLDTFVIDKNVTFEGARKEKIIINAKIDIKTADVNFYNVTIQSDTKNENVIDLYGRSSINMQISKLEVKAGEIEIDDKMYPVSGIKTNGDNESITLLETNIELVKSEDENQTAIALFGGNFPGLNKYIGINMSLETVSIEDSDLCAADGLIRMMEIQSMSFDVFDSIINNEKPLTNTFWIKNITGSNHFMIEDSIIKGNSPVFIQSVDGFDRAIELSGNFINTQNDGEADITNSRTVIRIEDSMSDIYVSGGLINNFDYTELPLLTSYYYTDANTNVDTDDGYTMIEFEINRQGYDDITYHYFEKIWSDNGNRVDYSMNGESISYMMNELMRIEKNESSSNRTFIASKIEDSSGLYDYDMEDISYSWYGGNSLDGSYSHMSDGDTCTINNNIVKLKCRVNFKITINDKKYQFTVDIRVPLS